MQVDEKALLIVKDAIERFEQDIKKNCLNQIKHISLLKIEIEESIKKQEKKVIQYENELKQITIHINNLEAELANADEDSKSALEAQLHQKRYEKEVIRKTLNKEKDKLEQLKIKKKKLEDSLDELLEENKKYKKIMLEKSENNLSGVEKCLKYVRDYLNT